MEKESCEDLLAVRSKPRGSLFSYVQLQITNGWQRFLGDDFNESETKRSRTILLLMWY